MTAAIPEWRGAIQPVERKPNTIENVVLPLDGSPGSRAGLPVAQGFADLYGAILHVVHVNQETAAPREMAARLGLHPNDMRGAVVDCYSGDAATMIVRSAKQLRRSLIVMSTHGGSRTQNEPFGSVTEAVLRSQPERIVLVAPERGEQSWHVRQVLLAHDGTPSSDAATAPAAEVAQLAGAEVMAVHVAARGVEKPEQPGSLPAPRYIDQPQHEWPSWANEFMERMMAMGAPPSHVRFTLMVTGGQPGSELAQVAREKQVDLVVMGMHTDTPHPHPSAMHVVASRSGCPVLLLACRPT